MDDKKLKEYILDLNKKIAENEREFIINSRILKEDEGDDEYPEKSV